MDTCSVCMYMHGAVQCFFAWAVDSLLVIIVLAMTVMANGACLGSFACAYQSSTGGYDPSDVASLPGGMRTSPNFPASAAALRFQTP